jgi:DNA polymerase-3 subunit alpha
MNIEEIIQKIDEKTNEKKKENDYLWFLALRGMQEKLTSVFQVYPSIKRVYFERLKHEFNVITSKGFAAYFLIVRDLIIFGKTKIDSDSRVTIDNYLGRSGLGPARGSAAGCLISYLLSITTIDPIPYGLFFARFLNPSRSGLPDIDTDWSVEDRSKAKDYLKQKYGEDHVASIGAISRCLMRGAVRDVARAMGYPPSVGDEISKVMPEVEGFGEYVTGFREALEKKESGDKIREMVKKYPKIFEIAERLEGVPRHSTVHAAGVIVSRNPLIRDVPLAMKSDSVFTQYDGRTVDQLGMLKIDLLGLKAVSTIRDTLKLIIKRHHKKIELPSNPALDRYFSYVPEVLEEANRSVANG